MIQTYLLVEDGFESRDDLSKMEKYDVLHGVLGRARGTVAAAMESITIGRSSQAATIFSVVLPASGPVGRYVLTWPNGDYEEGNLRLEGSRVLADPPIVTRPGR